MLVAIGLNLSLAMDAPEAAFTDLNATRCEPCSTIFDKQIITQLNFALITVHLQH